MGASHAPSDWWPRAVRRPVKFSTEGGPFSARPLGWILHVAVMNGSVFRTFNESVHPDRKSAHLWVAKDGTVEQYVPLSVEAWHAAAGNASYWGVETEGFPDEPLTEAQLDTLAAWHAWSGASDTVCTAAGQSGISAHYIGGGGWGGHTCPDPSPGGQGPRSHQRAEIIRRANGGTRMPITDAEIEAIALRTRDKILAVTYGTTSNGAPHTLGNVLGETLTAATAAANDVAALTAKVDALTSAVHALAAAGTPVTLTAAQVAAIGSAAKTSPDDVVDVLALRLAPKS